MLFLDVGKVKWMDKGMIKVLLWSTSIEVRNDIDCALWTVRLYTKRFDPKSRWMWINMILYYYFINGDDDSVAVPRSFSSTENAISGKSPLATSHLTSLG